MSGGCGGGVGRWAEWECFSAGAGGKPGQGVFIAGRAEFGLSVSRERTTYVKEPLAGIQLTILWLSRWLKACVAL